ncbi:MAG: PorT family protein [Flavobacteriales bacterium]|nr:PorT family protein [Flavobacteriales bacterium]MBL0044859.1 PorT family protein [Flavobacteriales bacterium]
MRTRSLVFCVLVPAALCAQMRHGPRLGLAIATQTAGQFLQWQGLPKFGPIVGWSFDIPYTHQIGFRLEPMVMSKGSWTRNAQLNTNSFVTLRYLELPVLLRLDLDTARGGFFMTGGAVYGYWLSGRLRTTVNGEETQNIKYDLAQPNVNRSQWSIAVGLGQQGKKWSWELRGQSSITPFDKLIRSQNLVFGLHVTYWLPLPSSKVSETEEEPE